MIRFDFLFGGQRKLSLIRELLEQRMRDLGFDDMESRLKVKELGNVELMGTPEAAIVTIIETVVKLQRQGLFIGQILLSIENHRKSLEQDDLTFAEIMSVASGSAEEAGTAIPVYCFYRINLEHPGRMTEEQFGNAFMQATKELMRR